MKIETGFGIHQQFEKFQDIVYENVYRPINEMLNDDLFEFRNKEFIAIETLNEFINNYDFGNKSAFHLWVDIQKEFEKTKTNKTNVKNED